MTRQAFIRVLLSLLLLISQQMASSHLMSHLAGSVDPVAASQQVDGGELSSAFAQDQSCSHCLAFAQLAGTLGSKTYAFALPGQQPSRIAAAATHDAGARTILAFQSRAPPQA
jgi:hypothetical protein